MNTFPVTVILDNVRSAYNVGSVLRTAACANIAGVISCGYTADAHHPRVSKTSLGSEDMLITQTHNDIDQFLGNFSKLAENPNKVYIFDTKEVLDDVEESNETMRNIKVESLWDVSFSAEVHNYLVFGHEVDGVRVEKFIEHNVEFQFIEIPMPGPKQSINVANSSAIGIYEVIRQLQKHAQN